ncbi:hypothetical protein KAR02_01490 [Candidatus Bipolaricaulota bacterium]|nr:hypothetical protein [Candidatus Bipolaricaulota bacterium]
MMNQLEQRRQEQKLLAENYSDQEQLSTRESLVTKLLFQAYTGNMIARINPFILKAS